MSGRRPTTPFGLPHGVPPETVVMNLRAYKYTRQRTHDQLADKILAESGPGMVLYQC
jgi:hypothetical protein